MESPDDDARSHHLPCGGLNAAAIHGFDNTRALLRQNAGARTAALVTAITLVCAAQILMPLLHRDAAERRRPPNVPKSAVHVGPAVGWWQDCSYDPNQDANICHTWNRGGMLLEEGVFVPYDGGPPAKAGELQISANNSGPDRVALENGRILIPKSREAEMKQFLDRLNGNRPTP